MSPPGEHLLVPIEAFVYARGESWEVRGASARLAVRAARRVERGAVA
jgi:hypothetical protein